jgi:hypothetical protein
MGKIKLLLFAAALLASRAQGAGNDFINPVQVITNCNMTTTCAASIPLYVMGFYAQSVQYEWTGTPVGVIGVSVSNQTLPGTNPPQPVPGSFTALTLTGIVEPSGSAGTFFLDLNTSAQWILVTYTPTSGAGTLNAYVDAKAF